MGSNSCRHLSNPGIGTSKISLSKRLCWLAFRYSVRYNLYPDLSKENWALSMKGLVENNMEPILDSSSALKFWTNGEEEKKKTWWEKWLSSMLWACRKARTLFISLLDPWTFSFWNFIPQNLNIRIALLGIWVQLDFCRIHQELATFIHLKLKIQTYTKACHRTLSIKIY